MNSKQDKMCLYHPRCFACERCLVLMQKECQVNLLTPVREREIQSQEETSEEEEKKNIKDPNPEP